MHYKFTKMRPRTSFGRWLHSKMVEHDLDCTVVSQRIHTTRQTVAYHVSGHTIPNYPFVAAYCSVVGGNPEEIWKLVELDKAGS